MAKLPKSDPKGSLKIQNIVATTSLGKDVPFNREIQMSIAAALTQSGSHLPKIKWKITHT